MDNRAVTFLFWTLLSFLQLFKSTDQSQHSLTQGGTAEGQDGGISRQPVPDSQSLTAIITQYLHSTGNTREKKRNGQCKSLHWITDWIGLHYGLPTSRCWSHDDHSRLAFIFTMRNELSWQRLSPEKSFSVYVIAHGSATVAPTTLHTCTCKKTSIHQDTNIPTPQGSPVSTRHSTSGCGQKYLLVRLAAHTWMHVPITCRDSAYSSQHHFSILLFQARRNSPQTETASAHYHLDWARL